MNDRPTQETDAIEQGMFGLDPMMIADHARRLERERDEARDALKRIEEYGTDEINTAVELRQKLAAALVERDEARAETNRTRDFMDTGFARAKE